MVHVALKRAVKTKLIPFNPADSCDLPRVDQKEAAALNADQLAAYQQSATGTWVDLARQARRRDRARRGECSRHAGRSRLAVRKLRIERSVYQIKGESVSSHKDKASRECHRAAISHRIPKTASRASRQDRAMFGADYRKDLDLIFADPGGNYLLPSSVTRAAVRLARRQGLPGSDSTRCDTPMPLPFSMPEFLLRTSRSVSAIGMRTPRPRSTRTRLPDTDQDVAAAWDKIMAQKPAAKPAAQIAQTWNFRRS